jgi:holo-[acyl-carrier protein] synthase
MRPLDDSADNHAAGGEGTFPPEYAGLTTGLDLIEIARIGWLAQQYGPRFLERVFTEAELALCRGRHPELAARFAGKEAAMKALGTGLRGMRWRDVEILRDPLGKPLLVLHGGAAERATLVGLTEWSISLSHTRLYACAVVVAR